MALEGIRRLGRLVTAADGFNLTWAHTERRLVRRQSATQRSRALALGFGYSRRTLVV